MMKRFWVFIFLFLAANFTLAQDMPPLPSDAPASAAPAKDSGMPALPDSGSSTTAPASAAPAGANDMPALPDAGGSAPAASTTAPAASNDMPALPDAGGAAPAKAVAPAVSNDMPALPDAGGSPAASTAAPAASNDMPALPDAGGAAPVKAAAPAEAAPAEPDMNAAPEDNEKPKIKPSQPWKASKARPQATFGGWVKAKGGNITSKLSWASQQTLNALDAKKYKMANEEGVYEGEQNKGPQYRKFTFNVPRSKDTVLVLLKQVGNKIWLRVGPDEEPAPENHTYAEVAKISQESMTVLHILKAKFAGRMAPHRMVPSWEAKFNRQKETLDE